MKLQEVIWEASSLGEKNKLELGKLLSKAIGIRVQIAMEQPEDRTE